MDETLVESFPASDPPAWNTGIARLPAMRPGVVPSQGRAGDAGRPGAPPAEPPRRSRATSPARRLAGALATIAGAAGIALLVPFAILLIGLPIALLLRGIVELAGWVAAILAS